MENVGEETSVSLARCSFGRYLCLSPFLRIGELGTALLEPLLRTPELDFLWPESELNEEARARLVEVRDQCLGPGEKVREELFVQRFRERMIDGTLAAAYLAPFINDARHVAMIERQLVRHQLPLIDFLHCLAVLFMSRLEEAKSLGRDANDGTISCADM